MANDFLENKVRSSTDDCRRRDYQIGSGVRGGCKVNKILVQPDLDKDEILEIATARVRIDQCLLLSLVALFKISTHSSLIK